MAQGMLSRILESEGMNKLCQVDSAGTHVPQTGSRPDQRAQQVAQIHGIDLSGMRARKVRKSDFSSYDYVVAMDRQNLDALIENCPQQYAGSLFLLLDFAVGLDRDEVPDPYYGNIAGFERVYTILDVGLRGLLGRIRRDLAERNLKY